MIRSIVKGVLVAWGVWAAIAITFYNLPAKGIFNTPTHLEGWVAIAYFPFAYFSLVIAAPSAPPRWMIGRAFEIGSSLAIYGLLGGLAATLIVKLRQKV
jgi:hypothetical protein